MRKFINRPEDVAEEMLQGLLVLHPGLSRLPGHKVALRTNFDSAARQVAILSGGGSGHEPAHAGFIGSGMLSAAVLGEVFTSPSTDSVLAAIKAVASLAGVLLVVKNYTGDRLNFGLAAELARAEGIAVEMLIVDDDVALKGTVHATGARGLAGTILIHKIVGAAAAEGKPLTELLAIGKSAVASLATMGVSLSAGTSPAVGKPSFELADNEMELGLGIHGEPGVQRTALQPADQLTETLLSTILRHGNFGDSKRVALLINNLGATTGMELAILARHAVPFLDSRGFTVERIYSGTLLSSLDMAGVSISVLAVDDQRLRWLDAPTTAPAWPTASHLPPGKPAATPPAEISARIPSPAISAKTPAGRITRHAIEAACNALIQAESDLTELDRITGDGDLGTSMERASRAILAELASYPVDDLPATLKTLANTLRSSLAGSSGPLYGVLFLRCATALQTRGSTSLANWASTLKQGMQILTDLGGAHPGDRTMLDALAPFAAALNNSSPDESLSQSLFTAADAASRGAESTARMSPRLGRSSYLGDRVLGHPDPGAKAVAIWLRAACDAVAANS